MWSERRNAKLHKYKILWLRWAQNPQRNGKKCAEQRAASGISAAYIFCIRIIWFGMWSIRSYFVIRLTYFFLVVVSIHFSLDEQTKFKIISTSPEMSYFVLRFFVDGFLLACAWNNTRSEIKCLVCSDLSNFLKSKLKSFTICEQQKMWCNLTSSRSSCQVGFNFLSRDKKKLCI